MTAPSAERFRFRPRFVGLVALASGLGAIGVILALVGALGPARELGLVLGAGAAALAPLFALSPAWRLAVEVDDHGLVVRGRAPRFRLAWDEIVRVVWSPTTTTMYVDGGAPERSLLVPGDGAPAPYDLERKPALCRAVLAHVAPDRVVEVASLDRAGAVP